MENMLRPITEISFYTTRAAGSGSSAQKGMEVKSSRPHQFLGMDLFCGPFAFACMRSNFTSTMFHMFQTLHTMHYL